MVLCLTLSRTLTTPLETLVSVPAHESCTSQRVPRTVAALYFPDVRKAPLPSPNSLRVLGFFAAAAAAAAPAAWRARGHAATGSLSGKLVPPPVCETLNHPKDS